MSSLSKCLKAHGLSPHEAAILRGRVKEAVDVDGLAAHEAAVQAVQEHIDELLAERTDVVTQITAAGGIAPDPGKAQNTGKELSDVGRTGQRQLSLLDAPARGARGDGGRGGEARQSPRVADRGPMGGGRPGPSQADGSQRDLDTPAEGAGTAGSGNDQRRAGERPQQRRAGQRDTAGERNQPAAVGPSNYTITADDELGAGGHKTKARQNLAAIRLLKTLAQDNRQATPEEQAVLVKYVGWGGLKNVFDEANSDWAKERAELKELVEVKEYEAARRSILDAHYTSATVVDGIYHALSHLGFRGGRVLEPALGTGHFFGLMPPSVMNASQLFGIELDPVTGAIAKHLYQRADINAPRGFEDVRVPEGFFDLAIGNPPFGDQTLNDADNPEFNKLSIHNFFFAKSIKSVRPGGVMAMVVSHYFLDAIKSGSRAYIAKHAEFLGAIRLPNTAFLKNANTEVTTDIVFFKKRAQPIKADAVKGETWLGAGEMKDAATGEPIRVGAYFLENPHMMLGRMTLGGTMYGKGEATLEPNEGEDLGDAIYRAVQSLPQGVYQQSGVKLDELTATDGLVPEHSKVGGLFVMPNGKLAIRMPDVLDKPQHKEYEAANERGMERIKGLVKVRDKVRDLMRAELNDDAERRLMQMRRDLNTTYDAFVKKQGFVNAQANRRAFHDDPDLPLLESLERDYDPGLSKDVAKNNARKIADATKVAETTGEAVDPAVQALVTTAREPSAKKAAIFERSVLVPYKEVSSAASAADALSASLNDRGRVDLDFMAQIYGRPADQIKGELAGILYEDPAQGWVTADAYLSGNVKQKLAEARAASVKNPQFKANVEALERVQPPDIPAVDISVRFGSSWVPAKDLGDFIHSLLGVRPASLTYQKSVARWFLNLPYNDNTLFNQTWGARTDEAVSWPANKIIGALLSNAPIIIKKNIGTSDKPHYVTLDQETDLARAKAEAIEGKFKEWVFADQARRERLERLYNDTYNTDQLRTYDGSHLTLPGTNPAIALTPNKRHSVWRIIQSPNTLLDHVVGSGKTFTIAAAFMEMRRLGIVKKPMVVVPNHIVRPWRDEWYALYPNANILATTEEDFKKENRKRLFAKIATGDWDAVIVAHSSFERIAMPPDEESSILNEQVSDIAAAIKEIKDDNNQRLTVRDLENMKARLEAKLQAAMDRTASKDEFIHFGEMGVDALAIDELHEFKNLYYYSQLRNVTGMGNPQGAGKSFDLFVKLRYLQKRNGRVIGATGTPISNSLVEMFTMQRFLDYDGLKAQGVAHLDAWAGVFADIMQVWETHPSGNGYRLSTRFARFVNLAELVTQYRKFADVITQADMIAMAQKAGGKYPIPKVMGGKPKMHIAERSELQSHFFGVPEFVRDGDGNIAFDQAKDAEGTPLYEDQKKTRPVLDPTKPLMTYNESSILWKYEHLRELMKESKGKINALSITNEARSAGLDYRLIDPNAADDPGAKSNLAAAEIERLYRKWDAKRGTQLVFIDLSTPKGTKAPKAKAAPEGEEDAVDMDEMLGATAPFSVYDDLRTKLIERGIPAAEIAFIHNAHTADQKNKLFGRVNRGDVRVLLGSTKKMGAGTNVQKRVVGKHDLDAPWRPSDLEQRDGRVVRQGNELYAEDPEGFEVELHRYATAKTYDTRMWQIIEHKASGIEQLRKGVLGARVMEDVSGEAANAAEMKAAASGNPLIAEEIKLRDRLKRLGNQFDGWRRGRYALETSIANLEQAPQRAKAERDRVNTLIDAREDKPEKGIVFTATDGAVITESKNVVGPVGAAFKDTADSLKPVRIGGYRGFSVFAKKNGDWIEIRMGVGTYRQGEVVTTYGKTDEFSPSGFIARLDNYLERFDGALRTIEAQETRAAAELVKARAELTVPFEHAKELEETREKHREIASSLQRAGGGVEMTEEMKRELEEARAKLQPSDKTALSRMGEVGAGMALPDVQAVADIYQRQFKGLKINVLASLKAAPAALRSDIRALDGESDTMGAWHDGEIYLFANRLDGPEHAAWVIAHEATHHGLRGMFKGALDPAMMEVYFTNRTVRAEANKLKGVNPNLSTVRAVEEALANMGGNGVPQNVIQRLVAAVKRLLRQAGVSLEVTDADVRDLVVRALRFVKRPARATHFMRGSAMHQAWHGSPHDFDAFSLHKIGTGEGAQAYGWGMYFAGKREVAEHYKNTLSNTADNYLTRGDIETLRQAPEWPSGSVPKHRLDELLTFDDPLTGETSDENPYALPGEEELVRATWADIADLLQSYGEDPQKTLAAITERWRFDAQYNPGRLYEVDLAPKEDEYLDWDSTPGSATPEFREKLTRAMIAAGFDKFGNASLKMHGNTIYSMLARAVDGPRQASEALAAAGIPGIRYLDGSSRGKGEGHHNYVIFDEKLVKIESKLSRGATGSGRAPVPQRSGLLDKAFRLPTQALQIDRLTGWAYDTLLEKLGNFVPDKVKAGVVADFGLPEQVTDRRADMQAHMRKALRQTQGFLQRMSELTRAESRIAYEWMTGQAEESTLEQLPEESREVMTQLRRLVSSLGTEAVRLGQLAGDVHEKNKLSYLHRSYLKHEREQGPQVKAKRARAVKILGDQYKGRGMAHEVAMAKIRNIAPDWWKRKLQAGKGDRALKGEGFLRLERRANRGEGVAVLPGMDATGQLGKLLEVAYWPAGEAVPARLQGWHQDAGTWEVRDVKGPNAILWRDFTKPERERMGEIDEVRYAVAKTLHQMVHDIEVGRYFEWLSAHHAKPDAAGLNVVKAGESLFRTFAPDEWVQVPDTNIEGTQVKRYGKLAGLYVPGPVWNDVRQVGNTVFQPLGETYATVLKAWKISKTALSPAVHLNNIMANVVMADWHDVMARDVYRALKAMVNDDTESRGLVEAFEDAGGAQGMYVLSEIQRDQLRPLLEALERDVDAAGGSGLINAVSVVQALLHGRMREAASAATDSKVAKGVKASANWMIDRYQDEDTVFRLAAFLKAKSEGKSDREAGKFARSSFLDYHINAPWIQMMRQTAFPFVSFVYRAVPMMLDTLAHKPWKMMKLAAVLGGLNALGYLFSGGDEDKERKLLPEEKRGKVLGYDGRIPFTDIKVSFGIAPKLIRMPWNDAHGSPVFLDIRRFIPVGDVLDVGQTHSAVPLLPVAIPAGPLAIFAEFAANKSQFTGKAITKETDTDGEKTAKVFDHLYKAWAPNLPFLPGTYSYTGIKNAGTGRTDAFGREQSLPAALASSVGIKIASYPRDMAQLGVKLDRDAKVREINENIGGLKRELQRRGITQNEFDEKVKGQIDKWRKIEQEAGERLR